MKTILRLVMKDYRVFWHDKTAVLLTFAVPMVLILIFGNIFGGMGGSGSGPSGLRLAIVNESEHELAAKLVEVFESDDAFRVHRHARVAEGEEPVLLDEAQVRADLENNRYRFALLFPPELGAPGEFGLKVRLLTNPRNGIESQFANGLIQKNLFSKGIPLIFESFMSEAEGFIGGEQLDAFNDEMAALVANTFGVDEATVRADMEAFSKGMQPAAPSSDNSTMEGGNATAATESGGMNDFLSQLMTIETEQVAGKEIPNPGPTQSAGGWAIMFLMFTLTGAASSLFDERKAGMFLRLFAAPVSRTQLLWSKYLYLVSLGVIQVLVLFIGAWFIFKVDVWSNFGNLLLVAIAAASACTALGMLLAAFCKTTAQANGLGTLLILSMSALGGAMVPAMFMPEIIQQIAKVTITYWAMSGFLDVLWQGLPTTAILPDVGILLGIAVVVNAISIWRFRTGDLFR